MKKTLQLFVTLSLVYMVASTTHADSEANIVKRLLGTWAVTNETADLVYSGPTAIGEVTFFDNRITINSGGFAAAGLVAALEASFCFIPLDPISFKFVGKGDKLVMYVSWLGESRGGGQTFPQDAVITIVELGRNQITMVGEGGCGTPNPHISHLERIE